MEWISGFFLSLFDTYICFRFYKCYFEVKDGYGGSRIILSALLAAAVSMTINLSRSNSVVNLAVSVVTVLWIGCLFKGRFQKKMLIAIIYLIFNMIIDVTVAFGINWIFNVNHFAVEEYTQFTYFGVFIYDLICFVIVYYLNRYRNKRRFEERHKGYIQLAFVPVLSIVLLFFYMNERISAGYVDGLFNYFFVMVIVAINIFLYGIFEKMEELYQEQIENTYIMQEMKYKESYYKNLEEHQEEIRMIRHDLKNQLIAIKGTMSEENTGCSRELDSIISDIVNLETVCFTKNTSINSILNAKYDEMRDKGITFSAEINIPESVQMTGRDIGILLGNILDNAIESCEKCRRGNRYIELLLCYSDHMIVLSCINSTDGKVTDLRTRKTNSIHHGWGMKGIDRIIKKYNGAKEIIISENTFKLECNLWNV